MGNAQNVDDTYGRDWKLPKSPKWEVLKQKEIPEWMIDAKFGMYTHWGIYSVPAHGGQITLKNCMRQTEKIERVLRNITKLNMVKLKILDIRILYQCSRLKNLMLKSG